MRTEFGLKEIDVFVRVVELGSFVKAARELHLTQSALTQRLKKLEDALGARLIDRTTRTVAPTAIGQNFLPAARRLLAQFEQSVSDIQDVIDIRGGRVTIACLMTVASYVLPRVVGVFGERHPNVRIRVLDESEQNIVEHVRRGEAEIAVDMRTDQPDDDLVMTTVMEDRFVLACRRDHPLANGRAVPWPELVDMPVVMLGQRSGTSRLVYTQLPRSRNAAAWRYEVQHLSTALSFIEAGLGVAVIPVMAMQALGEGALVYRPLVEPEVSRTIVVVERRDATLSPAAETLKALLIEEFRAWTAGDAAIPQRAVR